MSAELSADEREAATRRGRMEPFELLMYESRLEPHKYEEGTPNTYDEACAAHDEATIVRLESLADLLRLRGHQRLDSPRLPWLVVLPEERPGITCQRCEARLGDNQIGWPCIGLVEQEDPERIVCLDHFWGIDCGLESEHIDVASLRQAIAKSARDLGARAPRIHEPRRSAPTKEQDTNLGSNRVSPAPGGPSLRYPA